MRKVTVQWKIRIVLFIYCVFISLVFIFCMLKFQKNIESQDVSKYMQDQVFDAKEAYPDSSIIQKDKGYNIFAFPSVKEETTLYKNLSAYKAFYNEQIIKMLVPLVILFCSVLIATTYFLWLIIQRIQMLNSKLIAERFQHIKYIEELPDMDEALCQAFYEIKKEYRQHMEDYRRLHVYLSHEQKNAIALLRNNLELQRYERCNKNIDYIAESIDEILTLSDDTTETSLEVVDVILICATVCDAYTAIHPNISFTFCDEDAFVIAKERWIYQAVSNLLDNAVKYGQGKPIEVNVDVKHNSVIILVKDHGIGISKEKQANIFTHQYRINELNKDGYGIGLSLVSHVCDLCSGFVALESKPQKGTTFYLSFSCANISK